MEHKLFGASAFWIATARRIFPFGRSEKASCHADVLGL
jgi:hypothetical protein